MRQVVQNFRSGELKVAEVPEPRVSANGLLVANVRSLISAGTEKSTVNVAKKSLAGKAMERPDLVRKVLDKVRKDGIAETASMVFQRLDSPVALGYSCAGVVLDVGSRCRASRWATGLPAPARTTLRMPTWSRCRAISACASRTASISMTRPT